MRSSGLCLAAYDEGGEVTTGPEKAVAVWLIGPEATAVDDFSKTSDKRYFILQQLELVHWKEILNALLSLLFFVSTTINGENNCTSWTLDREDASKQRTESQGKN